MQVANLSCLPCSVAVLESHKSRKNPGTFHPAVGTSFGFRLWSWLFSKFSVVPWRNLPQIRQKRKGLPGSPWSNGVEPPYHLNFWWLKDRLSWQGFAWDDPQKWNIFPLDVPHVGCYKREKPSPSANLKLSDMPSLRPFQFTTFHGACLRTLGKWDALLRK